MWVPSIITRSPSCSKQNLRSNSITLGRPSPPRRLGHRQPHPPSEPGVDPAVLGVPDRLVVGFRFDGEVAIFTIEGVVVVEIAAANHLLGVVRWQRLGPSLGGEVVPQRCQQRLVTGADLAQTDELTSRGTELLLSSRSWSNTTVSNHLPSCTPVRRSAPAGRKPCRSAKRRPRWFHPATQQAIPVTTVSANTQSTRSESASPPSPPPQRRVYDDRHRGIERVPVPLGLRAPTISRAGW